MYDVLHEAKRAPLICGDLQLECLDPALGCESSIGSGALPERAAIVSRSHVLISTPCASLKFGATLQWSMTTSCFKHACTSEEAEVRQSAR